MPEIRYPKTGLVIPSRVLKPLGDAVTVQRWRDVVIIESPDRRAARKRLAQLVRRLRKNCQSGNAPGFDDITAERDAVRKSRARHR
jgi:hypothetical protein